MQAASVEPRAPKTRAIIPPEIVNIVGTTAVLFGVVASGSAVAAALPPSASPWLFASAYGAPAAVAFAVYWWVAQRV